MSGSTTASAPPSTAALAPAWLVPLAGPPIEPLQLPVKPGGVTLGRHPMAVRRASLAHRGVVRARDLARCPDGERVRVAGSVIVRQRPGTAKGFVFLSLEDETGIANVIV